MSPLNSLKRFVWPIAIATVVVVAWLVFTISQVSTYHALLQLHVIDTKQFERDRPTFGWYQMSDGRLAYEWAEDGGRDLSDEGANYHTYVPYADYQTKEWIAVIEISGQSESTADLRPLAYTTKGPTQVMGLTYPFDTIPPKVVAEFQNDGKTLPPGIPLLVMADAAVPPYGKIIDAGVVALFIIAIPFAIVLFKDRPAPKPKYKDPYKYKPSWRK